METDLGKYELTSLVTVEMFQTNTNRMKSESHYKVVQCAAAFKNYIVDMAGQWDGSVLPQPFLLWVMLFRPSLHAYSAQYILLHTAVLGITFWNPWVKMEVTGDVTKELYILTRHALSFKKEKVGKKWFNEIRNSWIIWHFVTVLIVFLLISKVSSQTLCSFIWRDLSHFTGNRGHIFSLYIL